MSKRTTLAIAGFFWTLFMVGLFVAIWLSSAPTVGKILATAILSLFFCFVYLKDSKL